MKKNKNKKQQQKNGRRKAEKGEELLFTNVSKNDIAKLPELQSEPRSILAHQGMKHQEQVKNLKPSSDIVSQIS